MIITLEKILDGSKHIVMRKLSSAHSMFNLWIDEQGNPITNSQHIQILDNAQIGDEIASLLYETRYKIVGIQRKS